VTSPAHAIAGMLALSRREQPTYTAPAVFGSLLPDLPIVLFYAVHKTFLHTAEGEIWLHAYFLPRWQAVFDSFHSLPLIAIVMIVSWRLTARNAFVVSAAMALHVLLDLPFHHGDAHRHLFPFSNWRFVSPVSYWDPRHFGHSMFWIESVFVLVGGAILLRRHHTHGSRLTVVTIVASYFAFVGYSVWVWVL